MTQYYTCNGGCCQIETTARSVSLFQQPRRRGSCYKAGVFIYDPKEDRVLLVQSRGLFWGAPKGTVENTETFLQCAIREVKEETGLQLLVSNLTRAIKIKNRALYYYAELPSDKISVSNETEDNDADGITWIKVDCLQECVESGKMVLNQHCRILLKRFLNKTFSIPVFVDVEKKV